MMASIVASKSELSRLLAGLLKPSGGHLSIGGKSLSELPEAVNPLAYAVGFVLSTGLLHAAGIALGLLIAMPHGKLAVRGGGGLISLAGAGFLFGLI